MQRKCDVSAVHSTSNGLTSLFWFDCLEANVCVFNSIRIVLYITINLLSIMNAFMAHGICIQIAMQRQQEGPDAHIADKSIMFQII